MPRVPITSIRTSHALTIKANGVTIGLINGWNPTQSRTVTPIYEVGADDSGNPVENMPGNITGLSISISRFDTYLLRMEQAFGTSDLVMLTRQNQPFEIFEDWVGPNTTINNINLADFRERFVYTGCWFTSLGRTLRSDDNRIVNVNATLMYVKKLKVTGIIAQTADLVGQILGV